MKSVMLLLTLFSANAVGDPDEALIEQLMRPQQQVTKAPVRRPPKTDPAGALVGQVVRVRTIGNGLYLGTLTAADAQAIHLDITTSSQTLGYALPRTAVASIDPVASP